MNWLQLRLRVQPLQVFFELRILHWWFVAGDTGETVDMRSAVAELVVWIEQAVSTKYEYWLVFGHWKKFDFAVVPLQALPQCHR